jgi:hypothetical protein
VSGDGEQAKTAQWMWGRVYSLALRHSGMRNRLSPRKETLFREAKGDFGAATPLGSLSEVGNELAALDRDEKSEEEA